MLKLGTEEKKAPHHEAPKEGITTPDLLKGEADARFFEIDFIINDKVLRVTVDSFLKMEGENLRDVSDEQIDQQFEKLNAWRHTFVAAGEELAQVLAEKQREIRNWLGISREAVIEEIVRRRLSLHSRTQGMTKSWFGSITKEELDQTMASAEPWMNQYHLFQSEVEELTKKINIMRDLVDNIKNRSFTLRYIGEKRMELNKQILGVKV